MKNLLTELKKDEITLTPKGLIGRGSEMDRCQSGPGPAFVQLCGPPLGIGLWVCQRAGRER